MEDEVEGKYTLHWAEVVVPVLVLIKDITPKDQSVGRVTPARTLVMLLYGTSPCMCPMVSAIV